ncbi:MAG TPA: peptide chain release factor-like protein [Kofleriaceae bacterium]|nr:peptide chain release factor-like protein [Kofleriaceae bacterium]
MTTFALQITSGVGPIEARRFVARLAARLERRAHAVGLDVTEVAASGGDDGPRSIILYLRGDAPGRLADELGTHALVDRSRGRTARKRWFAAVTLHPHRPSEARIELGRDDLEITACRAGGPGGQHVNKVATAVRVRHVPSGLSVRSAGERSQQANLAQALRRLAGLLQDRADARRAGDRRDRRDAHYRVERGRAIRTYTLDPDGALRETS